MVQICPNTYSYVLNNPLRFTDPSGYMYDPAEHEPTGPLLIKGQDPIYPKSWLGRSGDPFAGMGFDYGNLASAYGLSMNSRPPEAGPTFYDLHYRGEDGVWYERGWLADNFEDVVAMITDFFSNPSVDYLTITSYGEKSEGLSVIGQAQEEYRISTLFASADSNVKAEIKKQTAKYFKAVATYLRNAPFFVPGLLNPFFRAEAIIGDIGMTVFLSETDVGGVFGLVGKHKGVFKTYHEVGMGLSNGGSLGVEIGRIDYSGQKRSFSLEMLNSSRHKGFLEANLAGLTVGGSFAISFDHGERLTISSLQLGVGAALFGIPYNEEVKRYHQIELSVPTPL